MTRRHSIYFVCAIFFLLLYIRKMSRTASVMGLRSARGIQFVSSRGNGPVSSRVAVAPPVVAKKDPPGYKLKELAKKINQQVGSKNRPCHEDVQSVIDDILSKWEFSDESAMDEQEENHQHEN